MAFATLFWGVCTGPAAAQVPKDCVAMASGVPATVHEGRYNILCVRPVPGPLVLTCRVDGVTGSSALQVYPFAVEAAREVTLEVRENEDLPTITGTAGADARVFFSYAGPFDPIIDTYTLTCRW